MTVGKSNNDQTRTYQLDSQNLCTVTEEKDLRVLIDNDLQFENHILSKIKTANRITGLVRRNFKNIDFPGFLLLYKSMIITHDLSPSIHISKIVAKAHQRANNRPTEMFDV